MTLAELQLPQPTAGPGWSLFPWRRWIAFPLLLAACGISLTFWSQGLPLSWTADYDRARYVGIRRAIDADPHHLLGRRFDEVSRNLRLEEVPWDDVAIQQASGMVRLYHFRGFSLMVTLDSLPAGITPGGQTPWTGFGEESDRRVVLWLAHQEPALWIDGISTREERMRQYQKHLEEVCARINAEMERQRKIGRGADGEADPSGPDR
jgi:hypothetical protein